MGSSNRKNKDARLSKPPVSRVGLFISVPAMQSTIKLRNHRHNFGTAIHAKEVDYRFVRFMFIHNSSPYSWLYGGIIRSPQSYYCTIPHAKGYFVVPSNNDSPPNPTPKFITEYWFHDLRFAKRSFPRWVGFSKGVVKKELWRVNPSVLCSWFGYGICIEAWYNSDPMAPMRPAYR